MKNIYHVKLDEYEQEIEGSFARGEWHRVPNLEEELASLKKAAENTLKKSRNINIRITEGDLQKLKALAIEEGIPYQTLAGSAIHKLVMRDRD